MQLTATNKCNEHSLKKSSECLFSRLFESREMANQSNAKVRFYWETQASKSQNWACFWCFLTDLNSKKRYPNISILIALDICCLLCKPVAVINTRTRIFGSTFRAQLSFQSRNSQKVFLCLKRKITTTDSRWHLREATSDFSLSNTHHTIWNS